MLIVFSGLSGTVKATIARALAVETGGLYLRIDTIEQAIRTSGALAQDAGRSGYMVANELALSNLRLGRNVIVDGVDPVIESRMVWSEIASKAGVQLVNLEVICTDKKQHQRRLEARVGDIPALTPLTWKSVLNHEYEACAESVFRIDTALTSPAQAVSMVTRHLVSST